MDGNIQPDHSVHAIPGLILNKVRNICGQLKIVSLNRQIEVCLNLLGKSPLIDVAVLGQFKAGKSSFLNSLIGRPLLPVGAIPVTTVITRLQYGEKERAVVSHFDGTKEEIPLQDLGEFTAESKNPSNEKNVEVVDVELPSLQGYPGLRLVDTPGLGSVYQYHMQTAENWLPEVGTALLAISADRPLSEPDLDLIRNLLRHTPKIVLLLTKADLLSTDQQEEVVQFFQDTLQRELNRTFPTYLYSIRNSTDIFKGILETDILRALSSNRDSELHRILCHKIKSLADSCLSYLQIAWKAAMQDQDNRNKLHQQILGTTTNLTAMEEELIVLARAQAIHTRTNIDKYLSRFRATLAESLIERLKAEMPTWKGNLWKLTRRYEDWLRENMIVEIEHLSIKEHKHFFGTLIKAHDSFERYVAAFRSLLEINIEKTLGIRMTPAEWKMEVAEPAHPDVMVGRIFEFHFDLLWFLIPMFLLRKIFERLFIRKIPGQIYTNFSRLAALWEERINRTIEDMRKQTVRYIREETATIEALLSHHPGQADELRSVMSELQIQMDMLKTTSTT
jgi:GTP-binding protein EngB required for normal cell division